MTKKENIEANVYLFRWIPENFSIVEKQHINFLKLATLNPFSVDKSSRKFLPGKIKFDMSYDINARCLSFSSIKCRYLKAKDSNSLSDPYLVV